MGCLGGVPWNHHTKVTLHTQVSGKEVLPIRPFVIHVQKDRATVKSGPPCSVAHKQL